jgi:hypothetical protein
MVTRQALSAAVAVLVVAGAVDAVRAATLNLNVPDFNSGLSGWTTDAAGSDPATPLNNSITPPTFGSTYGWTNTSQAGSILGAGEVGATLGVVRNQPLAYPNRGSGVTSDQQNQWVADQTSLATFNPKTTSFKTDFKLYLGAKKTFGADGIAGTGDDQSITTQAQNNNAANIRVALFNPKTQGAVAPGGFTTFTGGTPQVPNAAGAQWMGFEFNPANLNNTSIYPVGVSVPNFAVSNGNVFRDTAAGATAPCLQFISSTNSSYIKDGGSDPNGYAVTRNRQAGGNTLPWVLVDDGQTPPVVNGNPNPSLASNGRYTMHLRWDATPSAADYIGYTISGAGASVDLTLVSLPNINYPTAPATLADGTLGVLSLTIDDAYYVGDYSTRTSVTSIVFVDIRNIPDSFSAFGLFNTANGAGRNGATNLVYQTVRLDSVPEPTALLGATAAALLTIRRRR